MGRQHAVLAAGDDQLGELRREKPLQRAHPLDLSELSLDAPLQLLVPQRQLAGLVLEPARLLLYRVVQGLDAQHRAHPRHQRRLIDRLCQVIVAAGLEPGDDVLGVGPRGDKDDRNEGQRGVGFQLLDRGDAVELRHHDVEQHEIGQLVVNHRERRLAVAGGDHLVALAFEAHLQDLDIVRHVVDDEDQRRLAHSPPPNEKRFT